MTKHPTKARHNLPIYGAMDSKAKRLQLVVAVNMNEIIRTIGMVLPPCQSMAPARCHSIRIDDSHDFHDSISTQSSNITGQKIHIVIAQE